MHQNLQQSTPTERAAELQPLLRDQAAASDAARRLTPEVVDALRGSGLMEIVNPERFGGRHDFGAVFEPIELVSRASGSAGWCFANWVQHNWMATRWPEAAQDDYFASGRDVLCSSAFMPGGRLLPVDGGFELTGAWKYSSGSDHAAWFMLGALAPGEPLKFVLVPREDCEVVDGWFVTGLRATGSNDVRVAGAFVPAERVVPAAVFGQPWPADRPVPPSQPSQALVQWPLINLVLPFALVGIVRGAIAAFEERSRASAAKGAVDDAAHLRLARAAAEVDSAHDMCTTDLNEMSAAARAGEPLTEDARLRYARNRAYVATLCREAVTRVHDGAGSSVIDDDSVIGRLYRDAVAGSRHRALSWDAWGATYGRGRAGHDVDLRQA